MTYTQRITVLKASAENLLLFISLSDKVKEVLASFDGKKVCQDINEAIGFNPNCRISVGCHKNSDSLYINYRTKDPRFIFDEYGEHSTYLDYAGMEIICERSVNKGKLNFASALPQIDAEIERWRGIAEGISSADYNKYQELHTHIAEQILDFRKTCSAELRSQLQLDFKIIT